MYLCPDCGSIINYGDPYCSYCGAYLKWVDEYSQIIKPNIPASLLLSDVHSRYLNDKLLDFTSAKDFKNMDVIDRNGEYLFVFTRENKYIRTTDTFFLNSEEHLPKRVFCDWKQSHNYDKLLINHKFRKLIDSTGFEFVGCTGGYESECTFNPHSFKLIDDISVHVHFRIYNASRRVFKLNLNKMTLSRKFSDFD